MEKREQLQEQIADMNWHCLLLGKDNTNKQGRESIAAKKIERVTKTLEEADTRIRDLEATMLCVVEKYYELNLEKIKPVEVAATTKVALPAKPILKTPQKKLISHRRLSTESF